MSAVNAFFAQRKKDLANGANASDQDTVQKLYGAPTPAAAPERRTFHVAVQGCCHGELTRIYDACAAHERETNKKIDLLICCGDFQSTRSMADLASMAVPDKYKTVGDFPRYYRPIPEGAALSSSARHGTGDAGASSPPLPEAVAPYLTLFVGGNHENSDWLAEESYGGFLAPNIYYLGHSGVVEVDGKLRLGGLSGIFKAVDYGQPYPAPRPYANSESGKRSAYHVRRIEQDKLLCYARALEWIEEGRHQQQQQQQQQQRQEETTDAGKGAAAEPQRSPPMLVDVMVSHDWPAGVTRYGDEEQLLRYKPYFRDEVAHNALGNPHTMQLLRATRPRHWLAAHLHCFFTAKVPHGLGAGETTTFTALDKCAKGKGFLDFLDIPITATSAIPTTPAEADDKPSDAPSHPAATRSAYADRIRRDPVWLAVLRRSHEFLCANRTSGSGGSGFNAEAEARLIADEFLEKDREPSLAAGTSALSAASAAPTTAALLRAMNLPVAAPLQVPMGSSAGAAGAAAGSAPSHQRQGRQQRQPPKNDGQPRGAQGEHFQGRPSPPLTQHASATQQPYRNHPVAAPPPPSRPAVEEELEPLDWTEDVG